MIKKLLLFFKNPVCFIHFSQEKSITKLVALANPLSSYINTYFNSLQQENLTFTIKNLLGKCFFKKEIRTAVGNTIIPFNRNHLRAGMYIYTIHNNTDYISNVLL